MRIHAPHLFGKIAEQRATAFLVLFTLDSACRSLLITIIPLRAYELLGSAQRVTLLYFFASFAGLATSLAVPLLLHHMSRRALLTAATLGYACSCSLYAIGTVWSLVAGLLFSTALTAALEILINLYMLEHVARRDLNKFEPTRLLFGGTAFVIGPWLGVTLHYKVATNLTFLVVGLLALVFVAWFYLMRLRDPETSASAPGERAPPNPLTVLPRFASQPRLVLAWLLAIGRNGWWLMYFVYTPILIASFGYSQELGGLVVSLGLMPMFLVRIWASLGSRFGIRRLMTFGYAATAVMTIAAGLFSGLPTVCLGFLCLAAFCATTIDGAGNVPFLRAMHPFERAPMTAVFMTFRHVASLVMPAIFGAVLIVAPLPGVLIASGVICAGMAGLCRYLPRGL